MRYMTFESVPYYIKLSILLQRLRDANMVILFDNGLVITFFFFFLIFGGFLGWVSHPNLVLEMVALNSHISI